MIAKSADAAGATCRGSRRRRTLARPNFERASNDDHQFGFARPRLRQRRYVTRTSDATISYFPTRNRLVSETAKIIILDLLDEDR